MVYAGYRIRKLQSNRNIVEVGAIKSESPFIDKNDVTKGKTGDKVKLEDDTVPYRNFFSNFLFMN